MAKSKPKFKITFITTIEYEAGSPENYPGCNTLEEMLALDIKNGEDDPELFMGIDDVKKEIKVTGEIIEE